jgi:hypothetical protein
MEAGRLNSLQLKNVASPRYQIRNHLFELVGEYTPKEILARIQAGRFTGEEEISAAPYEKWQKLASHPVFYDAFLQRLYSQRYETPPSADQKGSSFNAPSQSEGKTHRPDPSHPPENAEPEAEGKTHQIFFSLG